MDSLRGVAKVVSPCWQTNSAGTFRALILKRRGNIKQQIRAANLVAEALTNPKNPNDSIFKNHTPSILVIGGGVTGVVIASKLDEAGGKVVLTEKQKVLFPLQSNCHERWLHPHEYEWPLNGYDIETYPARSKDRRAAPAKMKWKAGNSADIASVWRKRFAQNIQRYANSFHVYLGVDIQNVTDIERFLDQILHHGVPRFLRQNFPPQFDLVISCLGANENTLEKSLFSSFRYWDDTPYAKPNIGIFRSVSPLRILISGAGDGGLQELFRIIFLPNKGTLQSVSAILNELLELLRASTCFKEYLESRNISGTHVYRPNPEKLWRRHTTLIEQLQNDPVWDSVTEKFYKLLHPEFTSGHRLIKHIFGPIEYPIASTLNSFLFHLFLAICKESNLSNYYTFLPNTEIVSLDSDSDKHFCNKVAADCHQFPHKVIIKGNSDGYASELPLEVFDIIIIRIGMTPNTLDIEH